MPMMATNQRMCAEYASAFGRLDGWERVTKIRIGLLWVFTGAVR